MRETSSGAWNDSDAARERRTEPVPVPVPEPVPVRVTGGIVAEREPRMLEFVTCELAFTDKRGEGAPPSTGKRSCSSCARCVGWKRAACTTSSSASAMSAAVAQR